MNPGVAVRVAVIRQLVALAEGTGKSQDSLDLIFRKNRFNDADRGLVTKLLYGSLRHAPGLFPLIDARLARGIKKTDARIVWTLVVAQYQLRNLKRVPPHAVVSTAVDASRKLAGNKAAKVVNAILRAELRETNAEELQPPEADTCYGSMAKHALKVLGAKESVDTQKRFLSDAPYVLRGRGPLFGDSKALCSRLEELGHSGMRPGRVEGSAILSSGGPRIDRSKKDNELEWIPQDEASQAISSAAAQLALSLDSKPSLLDACAGRGVKTDYLRWALGNEAQIMASDVSEAKLKKATALSPGIKTQKVDWGAREPGLEKQFDLVLIDAPCTGFGTMGRRPEIRLDSREPNLYGLMNLQGRILQNTAKNVRPGGILLYVICSFTREEGVDNAKRFLDSEAGADFKAIAMPEPPVESWATSDGHWCTLDAGTENKAPADIFFAAAFQRNE